MTADPAGQLAYLEFKAARTLYKKAPGALEGDERHRVEQTARKQLVIESRVLAAEEARGVWVPEASVAAALQGIRSRYADEHDFAADLEANGLTEAILLQALRRDLAVEAVLDRVSSRAAAVSDIDVELFYHLHRERFAQPERRRASHILITVNEDFPENRREAALDRIRSIAERVRREPKRFIEQAQKHSECPTAMQGGALGEYQRGQLFPSLDRALFELAAGELSVILESELGFHILRCDAVMPAAVLAFAEVRAKVRRHLEERRAQVCRKAWIKGLFNDAATAG